MKGSNLKFMELEVSDRGNYTCVASNAVGRLEFTFIVDVISKYRQDLERNVDVISIMPLLIVCST